MKNVLESKITPQEASKRFAEWKKENPRLLAQERDILKVKRRGQEGGIKREEEEGKREKK